MTFLIDFLGCKVNSYESECVGDQLEEKGYKIFDENHDKSPDVIIINTCAVTETSVTKDRKMIRFYRKKYRKAILVVMGCYSQIDSERISVELNVDIVLGTSKRIDIPELIERFKSNNEKIIINEKNNSITQYEGLNLTNAYFTTRAYLKIQDGCDNYCTYCILPYIRGRSRSRDKEEILQEVRRLINKGYKEIVLTGIDMGSYGEDFHNNYNFSDLVEEILVNNKDLYRLRISSLEESQIDDKMLSLLKKYPNLANHFHIPLQSGSVSILKKMNRKYNIGNFKETIRKIRLIRPDISITTDVIVGFPGETDEDFEDTIKFCKDVKFAKIHVFPYSRREGTIANKLPNQVEEIDKKVRVKKLIYLSDELKEEYEKQFIGKEIEFLFENYDPKTKSYRGHSSNYLELYYKSNENICDKIKCCEFEVTADRFDSVKKLFIR